MTTPTWTVQLYDAITSIRTAVINNQLQTIFTNSDTFPKTWKKDDPEGAWSLNAQLGAPRISFATDIKDGAKLIIPIESGSFESVSWKIIHGHPKKEAKTISLTGSNFTFETPLATATHQETQTVYMDMKNPSAIGNITDPTNNIPYEVQTNLVAILSELVQDSTDKQRYALGMAIQPSKQGNSPFTPQAVRFTTYQDAADETVGSLNWAMTVANDTPPSVEQNANAGEFDTMPVPTAVSGATIVSYGKIIRELILNHAFTSLGLDGSTFDDGTDSNGATALLNQDVAIPATDKIKKATFTKGNTKVYPDIANNRIQVDFEIDDIVLTDSFQWPLSIKSKVLEIIAKLTGSTPKYKAVWSGYITFSLDNDQNLKSSYTQSTPNMSIQDKSGVWQDLLDIEALGLDALAHFISGGVINESLGSAVTENGNHLFANIVQVTALPNNLTFAYTALDWYTLGLRAHLNEKSA